ncbi:hypothetical protein HPY42_03445 [Coprothermobacteraceae bacterium]|nr:hypothetical protein [Coprothermobacteraceae bacterium]
MLNCYKLYASYVDSVSRPVPIPRPDPGSVKIGQFDVFYLYTYSQVRELVHRWKFGGDSALGFRLGQTLGSFYRSSLQGKSVSYVPAFGEIYPWMGNHLFPFIAGVSDASGCRILQAYTKVRRTAPQKLLSRSARRRNLEGAFLGLRSIEVLLDHVATTGVTAQTLYKVSPFKTMFVLTKVDLELVY